MRYEARSPSIGVDSKLDPWDHPSMTMNSTAICKGSGKVDVRSHVDEPDGRGACGFCRAHLIFELVNGDMVPPEHCKPAKPKRRLRALQTAHGRNDSGRNRSGRTR